MYNNKNHTLISLFSGLGYQINLGTWKERNINLSFINLFIIFKNEIFIFIPVRFERSFFLFNLYLTILRFRHRVPSIADTLINWGTL